MIVHQLYICAFAWCIGDCSLWGGQLHVMAHCVVFSIILYATVHEGLGFDFG